MALFTDQLVSEVADLVDYEANLPDVSAAEGIDLATKLRLAHVEIEAQLEAASRGPGNIYFANSGGWQSTGAETNPSRFSLQQVVVTPPLKLFYTFQTLSIIYRDAYNRKLNDKYLPKWNEYKELANWARDLLFQTGIGISASPIPRPQPAALDWVTSTLDATARFVRMTWTGENGAEGAGSAEQAIDIPAGNALRVSPPAAPPAVAGWNVYAGETSGLGKPLYYEGRYGWMARFVESPIPDYDVSVWTALNWTHGSVAHFQIALADRGILPEKKHPLVPPHIWRPELEIERR